MTTDLLAALNAAIDRARAARNEQRRPTPEPSRVPVTDIDGDDDPAMRYTPAELDAMADDAADKEAGWDR